MLLLTDPSLRAAVARTPAHAADSLTALASVAAIDLTPNLSYARVYVSIYARDPAHREAAMARLTRMAPYVRRRVAAAMRLRLVPEIRFVKDETQEAGAAVDDAIAREAAIAAGLAEPPPITLSARGLVVRSPPREGYAPWADDDDDDTAAAPSRTAFPDVSLEARAEAAEAAAAAAAADEEEEEDGFYEWPGEPVARVISPPSTEGDDFFGFEAPPDDGFWKEGSADAPSFGDGVLGADGFVRLAPGAGPAPPTRSGGGGGGRRKTKR